MPSSCPTDREAGDGSQEKSGRHPPQRLPPPVSRCPISLHPGSRSTLPAAICSAPIRCSRRPRSTLWPRSCPPAPSAACARHVGTPCPGKGRAMRVSWSWAKAPAAWKTRPGDPSSARQASCSLRSSPWAAPRRRRCSTPNSRWARSATSSIGSGASPLSLRTIRPPCSGTPTGRSRPGMTSASPAVSSTERDFAGRQAPWSNEAEQAVLGAMLLDQDAALKAAEVLDDTMFYREGHRLLFRSMIALTERGDVIDPVTLRDELMRRGDLDRAGGMEYLGGLIDVVPTAANVDYHAKIVRDKAVLRRLIEAATSIIQDAYDGRLTSGDMLDNAEHRVFQVAQLKRAEEFVRLKELIWPTMERIEQLHTSQGALTGVASGFTDLDRLTAGFQRGDLIIIAARPSMGKTAFALNVVQHAAIEHDVGVAIFSLEMTKDQLVQRLLCSEGLVDAQRLRRGLLHDDDYPKLARAAGLLGTAPIWIDDSAVLTPLAMRSKARRLKADHDIGMVVVDYLQMMHGPSDAENRQQEISFISRSLKALAKELDVPLVALSQLSRAPEQRGGEHRRPQLSDLRESGAIEQDADVVCFIYRQEFYDGPTDPKTNESIEGLAELLVGKQRNGPTGPVKLYFKKEYTRFDNYSPREPPSEAGRG